MKRIKEFLWPPLIWISFLIIGLVIVNAIQDPEKHDSIFYLLAFIGIISVFKWMISVLKKEKWAD